MNINMVQISFVLQWHFVVRLRYHVLYLHFDLSMAPLYRNRFPKGIDFTKNPCGAPGAAVAIEELHAMGCEKFIICGGAGALTKDSKVPQSLSKGNRLYKKSIPLLSFSKSKSSLPMLAIIFVVRPAAPKIPPPASSRPA